MGDRRSQSHRVPAFAGNACRRRDGADHPDTRRRRSGAAVVACGRLDPDGTRRQTSLIIDVFPFEHPDSLPRAAGFVRCEADLPVTSVPIAPPMLRFEFMLAAGTDIHEAERPDNVYRLLSRWFSPGEYRIMRTDAYEWHAHLVHGGRQGRIRCWTPTSPSVRCTFARTSWSRPDSRT